MRIYIFSPWRRMMFFKGATPPPLSLLQPREFFPHACRLYQLARTFRDGRKSSSAYQAGTSTTQIDLSEQRPLQDNASLVQLSMVCSIQAMDAAPNSGMEGCRQIKRLSPGLPTGIWRAAAHTRVVAYLSPDNWRNRKLHINGVASLACRFIP